MKGQRREVLLLAIKTGWSRAEILALPASEFRFYIRELTSEGNDEEE